MDDKLSTHEAGTRQSSSYYRTSIQHTRYERSVNLATTSSHLIFKDRTSKPVSSFPIQPLSPNDLPTWSSIGDRNKHRVPSQDAVISRNVKTPPAAVSTTQTSIEKISNPIPKSTLNGDLNKHRLPSQSIFEREFGSKLTTPPAQQKFLEYKASMPKETVSQLNNGTRYDLKKPGYVLIFNQEKFNDKNLFREGTMKDEKDLINLFKKFNVEKFISNHDLSLSQIESRIHKVRRKDFRKYSCLIVTIMTHGCQNDVLLAKDEQYNFKDTILEPLLQNTTLSGKPKIFIIQACRGDKVSVNYQMQVDAVPFTRAKALKTTPEADVFRCCSTFEGRLSYRHPKEGSPFIQNFIKVTDKNCKTKPINDIMEEITSNLATDNPNAQTPVSISSLTKKFYFGDLLKNK